MKRPISCTVAALLFLLTAISAPIVRAQTLVTGVTLNSSVSAASVGAPVVGNTTIGFTITGLGASGATLTVKDSSDGGANYFTSGGIVTPTITQDGVYSVNVAGRSNVELVVTSTGTGIVTVSWDLSPALSNTSILAGNNFTNLAASIYAQVKTGPGVFAGLTVDTIGTTSAVKFYDGTSSTVTITLAAPGVVSWTGHPFVAGSAVVFETTSALPTGLTAGTTYYVSSLDLAANSFVVADTKAHALAGTNSITTSVSQAGVQSAYNVTNLIGAWSTVVQDSELVGAQFSNGLIAAASDGGGAANLTILYR